MCPSMSPMQAWNESAARDAVLVELMRAYRSSGGMACGRFPAQRAFKSALPPIFFEHAGIVWMPRFQFDFLGSDVRPECRAVLNELTGVCDGWEQAIWLASPNLWLANARPVDLIETSAPCVLGAARADRFIAIG
jgi:hypothetical protein